MLITSAILLIIIIIIIIMIITMVIIRLMIIGNTKPFLSKTKVHYYSQIVYLWIVISQMVCSPPFGRFCTARDAVRS